MEEGVVVLLDAIGVREEYQREDSKTLIKRWNAVDRKIIRLVNVLKSELKNRGYNSSIRIQQPYDNIQIFLPFDKPKFIIEKAGDNKDWMPIRSPAFKESIASKGDSTMIFNLMVISILDHVELYAFWVDNNGQ